MNPLIGSPREVTEMALARVNKHRVEAAHRPCDLFERRRSLMADWAAHCAAQTGQLDDDNTRG